MVLPEEIEQVDVIYGPYSALYSGNAMGAAVLFTTRMPDDFEATASLQAHQQQFNYLGTDDSYDGHPSMPSSAIAKARFPICWA